MNATSVKQFQDIAKNVDFALRVNNAKFVLVASDCSGEGKSFFLTQCAPLLTDIYQKKVLIYDCQLERDDVLEKGISLKSSNDQFIKQTAYDYLDYLHQDDLTFVNTLPQEEKISTINSHFYEATKDYDVVFINMKTMKRSDKSVLPTLPIDGAILVRSSKGMKDKDKFITNELSDRDIPILGMIRNEGV